MPIELFTNKQYGTVSTTVRIHGSRNQSVEMGVAFTIIPSDVHQNLYSCPYDLMLS